MATTTSEAMVIDPKPIQLTLPINQEEALALRKVKDVDEKAIRQLSRRVQSLLLTRQALLTSSAASTSAGGGLTEEERAALEDARFNVQLELDGFMLLLERLELSRNAEARQAEEYELSRQQIELEYAQVQQDILNLKDELREAEALREQRKEYDEIAEKINQLPTRAELDMAISDLQAEISTIQADASGVLDMARQKQSLMEQIQSLIADMAAIGKDTSIDSAPGTPEPAPPADLPSSSTAVSASADVSSGQPANSSNTSAPSSSLAASNRLNPAAAEFHPTGGHASGSHSVGLRSEDVEEGEHVEDDEGEDVIMNASSSPLNSTKFISKDDLEEGETSE